MSTFASAPCPTNHVALAGTVRLCCLSGWSCFFLVLTVNPQLPFLHTSESRWPTLISFDYDVTILKTPSTDAASLVPPSVPQAYGLASQIITRLHPNARIGIGSLASSCSHRPSHSPRPLLPPPHHRTRSTSSSLACLPQAPLSLQTQRHTHSLAQFPALSMGHGDAYASRDTLSNDAALSHDSIIALPKARRIPIPTGKPRSPPLQCYRGVPARCTKFRTCEGCKAFKITGMTGVMDADMYMVSIGCCNPLRM